VTGNTKEVMEKIRAAEAEAAEITAAAKQKAAQSIAAARAASADKIEEAQKKARQIAAIGEEESKRETDAHIDAAQKKARGQAKKIVAAAEENMHTAVNEIIRGIFEKWQ